MRSVRFRRGLVFMGVTLAAAACTSTPASRTPAKSITATDWEGKVDGVALAAAHADFDPHPQQVRVFKTNLKSAMRAMARPTTLVQLAPADPAYLAIVTGHQSNIGTYRDGRWVGARVQLVLVISAADKLASYWSSGAYSKTKLSLAGLGAPVELPTSLPRVPVIPDIFGVERLGFDGFPVVGKNDRTITVLTVQQCGGPSRLEASPYPGRVLLVITAPNGAPDQACPTDLVILSVSTTLSEPLGARVLANGISGKTVPYFDDRSLPTITVVPRDYRCGTGEPGAFELKGSGVGATVDCSGPATDSAPLTIEQEQGAATETGARGPSWAIRWLRGTERRSVLQPAQDRSTYGLWNGRRAATRSPSSACKRWRANTSSAPASCSRWLGACISPHRRPVQPLLQGGALRPLDWLCLLCLTWWAPPGPKL